MVKPKETGEQPARTAPAGLPITRSLNSSDNGDANQLLASLEAVAAK